MKRRVGDNDHLYLIKPVRMAMPELDEEKKDTVAKTGSKPKEVPKTAKAKTSDSRIPILEGYIANLWKSFSRGLERVVLNSADDVADIDQDDLHLCVVPNSLSQEKLEAIITKLKSLGLVCFQFNQRSDPEGYKTFKEAFDSGWFITPKADKDVRSILIFMKGDHWKELKPNV